MVKISWLVLVLMLLTVPAFAVDKPVQKQLPQADQKPDPALLEFLGTWESPDGSWVDPMTFARIDPDKTRQDKTRRDGKLPSAADKPASKHSDDGGSGV
ncbi:MAG TPA: hypothetical protein VFX47_07405 [Gammaproteobacteria bacterium]|nr:hypothetical protein [Gammaproteobacteria bacterium]